MSDNIIKYQKDVSERKNRRVPASVKGLRFGFRILETISPPFAAYWAYKLWFTSPRYPEPAREKRWRDQAERRYIEHKFGPIATYRWGQGPTVVLVHGWSGRGTQMAAFASPLVKAGYSVVAFDAPGHGYSPGNSTTIFEIAEVLQAIAAQENSVEAIIAHSFGSMVSTYALKQGLSVQKIVCISSPTSPKFLLDSFRDTLAIGTKTERLFKGKFEVNYGADIWDRISADTLATGLNVPALIIHDKNDMDVPWFWGQELANAWPGAYFWLTEDLGHRRILRNKVVLSAVTDFIQSNKLPKT